MNQKRIRILQDLAVYAKPKVTAPKVSNLVIGQILKYNREKIRKGISWLEIYLEDGTKGYIKNETHTFFVIKSVVLTSDVAMGISYTQKTEPPLRYTNLFYGLGHFSPNNELVDKIEVKTIFDSEENIQISRTFMYDRNVVDVREIYFTLDDEFYVLDYLSDFMEVEDAYGEKSLLLTETEVTSKVERTVSKIAGSFAIPTGIAVLIGFFMSRYYFRSNLKVIAMVVVTFVVTYVVRLVIQTAINKYNQVKKRL